MKINETSLFRQYVSLLTESAYRESLELNVPDDVKEIHRRMERAGKELYVVGGAIRDALLNKRPKDYDLATDATPDEVIKILERHGRYKLDLQGKAFGVVRVFTPAGEEYEIATFREDIGAGRRPNNVEFVDIENDVKRRDLTMNALFYDLSTGEVVDYVGGIGDIRDGIARAVGDPVERFYEDKLRMLRAVRFAGRTGFEIDQSTAEAIKNDPGLRIGEGKVSGEERITEEFKKGIQTAQNPNEYIEMLFELGLLQQIFPGLAITRNIESMSDDPVVHIALLLKSNIPSEVKATLQDLRYSNDEKNAVDFLINFNNITPETAAAVRKLFKRYDISDVYLYDFADATGIPSSKVRGFLEFVSAPQPVSSQELMAQGIKGKDLGVAISAAWGDLYQELIGESNDFFTNVYRRILNEEF